MTLTIVEFLRAINPNIGLVQNPDGSYRIGVEDVNSDEILAATEAINTALQAGGISQVQFAAIVTALQAAIPIGANIIGQVGIDQTTPGSTNRVDAQLSGLSIVPFNLFEWTNATYIATQLLTADGVQWSDEKTIGAGGAETQVFGATISPAKAGILVAVLLGLTVQCKSSAATQAKSRQWRARNVAGAWVNLMAAVSENLTVNYVESSRSGVFYAVANFNQVPFEIGLFVTPSAAESFIVQVKSSSMGQLVYKPS